MKKSAKLQRFFLLLCTALYYEKKSEKLQRFFLLLGTDLYYEKIRQIAAFLHVALYSVQLYTVKKIRQIAAFLPVAWYSFTL
jgi:hypothetical protein